MIDGEERASRSLAQADDTTAVVMCGGGLGAYDMVRMLGPAAAARAVDRLAEALTLPMQESAVVAKSAAVRLDRGARSPGD